jgi:hypothetical protein
MPTTFYRGDSRPAAEIKSIYKGFQGWVPLTADQARLIVKKGAKDKSQFPPKLATVLGTVVIKNNLDLQLFIKYTKNKSTTPQVSTAADPDCGGQANGKDEKGRPFVIYKIEYEGLRVALDGGSSRAIQTGDIPHTAMFPKVLHDTDKLETANTVAIAMKDEIAFLTSIPLDRIKQYKEQGKSWVDM